VERLSQSVGRRDQAEREAKKVFFALLARGLKNFVTFVLFVVINFLTTKDTKHTKEEGAPYGEDV